MKLEPGLGSFYAIWPGNGSGLLYNSGDHYSTLWTSVMLWDVFAVYIQYNLSLRIELAMKILWSRI